MSTAIVSLSEFKAKAARMLAEKNTEHAIVLTQRGAASAVVQDFDAEAHGAGRGRYCGGEDDPAGSRVRGHQGVLDHHRGWLKRA